MPKKIDLNHWEYFKGLLKPLDVVFVQAYSPMNIGFWIGWGTGDGDDLEPGHIFSMGVPPETWEAQPDKDPKKDGFYPHNIDDYKDAVLKAEKRLVVYRIKDLKGGEMDKGLEILQGMKGIHYDMQACAGHGIWGVASKLFGWINIFKSKVPNVLDDKNKLNCSQAFRYFFDKLRPENPLQTDNNGDKIALAKETPELVSERIGLVADFIVDTARMQSA